MHRLLIVSRIVPGAQSRVAEIFAESDQSELPSVTGVRHRSLYHLDDLFVHLIETDGAGPAGLERNSDHPLLVRAREQLARCTSPYLPGQVSPRDAMARCFYHWDAPAVAAATGRDHH